MKFNQFKYVNLMAAILSGFLAFFCIWLMTMLSGDNEELYNVVGTGSTSTYEFMGALFVICIAVLFALGFFMLIYYKLEQKNRVVLYTSIACLIGSLSVILGIASIVSIAVSLLSNLFTGAQDGLSQLNFVVTLMCIFTTIPTVFHVLTYLQFTGKVNISHLSTMMPRKILFTNGNVTTCCKEETTECCKEEKEEVQ